MKNSIITTLITGTLIHTALAVPGTVIWSDNFDTADTADFDAAPLTGRLGGSLASAARLYKARLNPEIQSNKLLVTGDGARVQFRIPDTATWYNWTTSAEAPNILTRGGFRVEFDFTPPNLTSDNWVSFSVGINEVGFNPGIRVNLTSTDYAILFRNNGGNQRFDNSADLTAGTAVTPTATQHVVIDCAFTSFADGQSVQATSSVNGTQVASDSFTWNANGGNIFMELESIEAGTQIDNLKVSTLATPSNLLITQDDDVFVSGVGAGGLVSLLSGTSDGVNPEPSTFVLVAGSGDTDNAKFAIDGARLEAGSHDFTQDPGGTQYFVRIKGTGNVTGGTETRAFMVTLINDDDADGLLDDWELNFAGNLTKLNGLASGPGPGAGTGDFDGDGISDLNEYAYSLSNNPTLNPTLADSDADGLNDKDETNPPGSRAVTNPLAADTDRDGLSDLVETNDGTYNSSTDTGTSGMNPDTDADGSRDGFEVVKGSIPTNFNSRPVLPPAFAIVQVTDDASTGISTSTTYTHKMSGGSAATINGVTLEKLGAFVTPANFAWGLSSGFNGELSNNNAAWTPASGGVTGPGVLDMYSGMVYDSDGSAGAYQTYTLNGLTIGQTYALKIFIRPWNSSALRSIDLEFTNGSTVEMPFGALLEDRPGTVLNNGNQDSAYYLSYTYVAETTDLVIKTSVHPSVPLIGGSFHLYGLTNEVAAPGSSLATTGVSRDALRNFIIDFLGEPSTTYKVTKSPDLIVPFGPLTTPLTATTSPSGFGRAIVPASEASEAKEFYRIEK